VPPASRNGISSWTELKDTVDILQLDGLDKVMIKPGIVGLAAVFFLSIPRHGDQRSHANVAVASYPACDFISVHARQADVKQNKLGSLFLRSDKSSWTVVSSPHLMAQECQKLGHAFGRVNIVIDDE
jgi:hypothetical protein